MKTLRYHRLRPALWLCAGTIAACSLGTVTTAHAAGDKPAKPARKPVIPKKMAEALEEKNGKPLTDEQKDQVIAAMQAQMEARKAADEKFAEDVAKVFGWTAADVKEAMKPKKVEKTEAAPAAEAPK